MAKLIFQDYRNKIMEALIARGYYFDAPKVIAPGITSHTTTYTLLQSFINQPIQTEISGNVVIGGPTLPMVAIANNQTGQLEFFALRILLPDIQI
jgi:hypothetical protein